MSDPPPTHTVSSDTAVGIVGSLSLQADADIATDLAATVSPLAFFPSEWEVDRQETIRLLISLAPESIEQVFKAVAELLRHGLGGNQLSEQAAASSPPKELMADVVDARDELLADLNSDQPRVSSIRLAARALMRAIRWLGDQASWLTGKGLMIVVATGVVVDDADQILGHIQSLEAKLTAIVTPIAHLLASLHLPLI